MRRLGFLIVIPALFLLTACGSQEPGTMEQTGSQTERTQPGGQAQQPETGAQTGGQTGGATQEKAPEQPKS